MTNAMNEIRAEARRTEAGIAAFLEREDAIQVIEARLVRQALPPCPVCGARGEEICEGGETHGPRVVNAAWSIHVEAKRKAREAVEVA